MALVTYNTLLSHGFNFSIDDKARIEEIISIYEGDILDAALSPQLADIFVGELNEERFAEIREGWIGDDNVRYKGLDYAANSYIAYWCIVDGSMSIVNRKETTKVSENSKAVTPEYRLKRYNEASMMAMCVADKIKDEAETFPEFTEVKTLGFLMEYDN